jgi:hypothetical protein
MDSVNFVYRARVTISHVEQVDPFAPVILTGNQGSHISQRFLHFNGRLDFGNVPTTIRAVTNTPTTGVSQVSNEVHTALGLTFNGDALRKVRLDGKFRWMVPDETTFSAFFEINQYESGSDEQTCGPQGKDSAEVILGAVNVPFDFLSPNLRADINTKFSFDVNPSGSLQPIGFAGSVQKTAGEVSFEAFSITDLAVAVAFGEQENYLSAALGLRFNSYKAKGGIFFGRTCTLQPIMMWDLFAASALGQPDPTFTGAYVYGEAHIPVSEAILGIPATCFFEVNAGMGLGIFYFVEGPTYGARGKLAVSGSALCMLSLSGELNMVGLKQGSKFKLKGSGTVAVEIGACPLCVEASRTVNFSAETGGGKSKGGPPKVK